MMRIESLTTPILFIFSRPLSLRVTVQRRTEKPEKLNIEITLD